ncbi:hypothetical protein CDL15_Pgr015152 [Punica granatum]|uniref:J domain-containing protein n=1 Tax=Punica granatum TaxID=22663 RepID=A0A218VZU0_PUNGR|nr:hypothetical protein CDL15_Pgr015152 [Punica granatum]
MASAAAPQTSFYSLLTKTAPTRQEDSHRILILVVSGLRASSSLRIGTAGGGGGGGGSSMRSHHHHTRLLLPVLAVASQPQGGGPSKRQRAAPGVDTRIHWDNPDEGWIGGGSRQDQDQDQDQQQHKFSPKEEQKNLLGEEFADLLNNSSDSHYQLRVSLVLSVCLNCKNSFTKSSALHLCACMRTFLGVSVDSDLEEIKAAYRRLSKEYHPDTTSLPLKTASDKFLKLREVYDILSNEETRRFYDWTLAQEAASRQAEKMRMRLEDPYEQDLENYKPVPDTVDRLGGRNMDLSDQAMSALTIDVFIILFAVCCIIYVVFFKEPYY